MEAATGDDVGGEDRVLDEHDARPGSFWQRLAPDDRQALRAMGRRAEIPADGLLCHQGALASGVYVLFRGRIASTVLAKEYVLSSEGDESIIELFGAGDLIGALAPWGHPQRGSVAALERLTVLRVDRGRFGDLLAANPRVTEAMMEGVARSADLSGRRAAVSSAEHPRRLAYHLLELGHRFGERFGDEVRVPQRLSQAELANWSGISRETLVRWFRIWRNRGILDRALRPLTILDPDGLRNAASPWGDEWSDAALEPAGRPAPHATLAGRVQVPLDAPPGAAARRPVRLPDDKPFFTGRTVSLGKLDLLLSQEVPPRGVVIEGMAGIGKTTLALHWAHRTAHRFPDGVVFADLRGTGPAPATPAEAMGQVLRGLGVPGDLLPRAEDELAAQCRSLLAGRRMLLILDNAADVGQVRPLAAATDAGMVVVTTQRRMPNLLEGADVRTLELREMAPDEAVEMIAAVLGPADRRVRDEGRATVRLAEQCGLLPLALAVVAGRLADNPADSIAATVKELAVSDAPAPAGVLAGPGPPGLHALLSPTFELAYRGLRRDHRAAFRRLGLLAGPDFTPAALAALTGRPAADARAALAAFRQTYLVQEVGPGRYRLHDLLRDFARERGLAEDLDSDRLAAQRRLLAGYLAEARAAGAALGARRRPALDRSPRPAAAGEGTAPPAAGARAAAVSWFEAERRNLVAAVHQAARLGLHRTCWELADALFDLQDFRRYSDDVIAVHQAGLRAARAEEDWGAAAVMMHALAVAHAQQGRSLQAIAYGEDARRGFRSVEPPDRHGEAVTLATLADVHVALGRYPSAIVHASRSLDLHVALGDRAGVARAHETLARAHNALADYPPAERHARHALELRRDLNDPHGVAETLLTLSQVRRRRGSVHHAVSFGLEALAIRQEQADRFGTAQALTELARMYTALGMRDLARRDGEQALRSYRMLGARPGEARALATLGRLSYEDARFAASFTYLGQALALHRDTGDRQGEAEALSELGIVHWRLGRHREAREHLVRALEIRREIGDQHGEAHDLEHLAIVMRRMGRHEESFVLGLEALDLWHRLGAKAGLAGTLGSLARTYLRLGLPEEAERAAAQALAVRREIGDWYGMGVGTDTVAVVLRGTGRHTEALKAERDALRLLREVGDRHGESTALVHLAAIHLALGDDTAALATGRQALDLATELGDARELAGARHVMGGALQHRGEHAAAAEQFRAEIELRRDMGDHRGRHDALSRLRDACLAEGDQAGADDCARRIRAIEQWLDTD
ncbi:tetratricopeptide repeat protein [Actinomadura parmotrematis]|uniref:Tetratricopeptide repeat protein n=1 Tax=Actinomadura parmotrematis TaxID=2864039 RepID=A0ABS7FS37_9ACTN|nr:tetratricopeptide repeat protein [Actinomadura parmotrematis]MBW8483202.1 tetratricopeptide repeat protein [Actinomadura parmotrematis]